jgi:GDPmannose 4,6-dehydratase
MGDPSKAKQRLGWEPKVKLPELVQMMVKSDLTLA